VKIRVLGGGWYGCHIALTLLAHGHKVELHEITDTIFAGASGGIPARLHLGFHYPRSRMTRAACLSHASEFMDNYGFLTRGIPVNLYAIAEGHSLVDFDQYVRTLQGEVPFIPVYDPEEFGLRNVEGAVLTGERHIVTSLAKEFFERQLGDAIRLNTEPQDSHEEDWDWTIDCTFCANESAGVDRYEPCVVGILAGPVDTAVTIMDGPFGSVYPWEEDEGLCSLSSAKWTPFSKDCRTWDEAKNILDNLSQADIDRQIEQMIEDMGWFYPAIGRYEYFDHRLSIRAMPLSGADTRLVDVVKTGPKTIRVRAGKIDAVVHAMEVIDRMILDLP
jgi:hypothetical protein